MLRQTTNGARFVNSAIEGLDAIVLSLLDYARERSEEGALLLASITSENGNGTRNVRSVYLAQEGALDATQRLRLLAAANYSERLIWLFAHMLKYFPPRSAA